ncbi:tetratricopeptide repeat protein [Streptomyces sp. DSM 42041]|uniref:Tetratricopeptide repeat protein n=1 Tax=Streptomyces hazeniae TaxID=3075538 RepID=A0ABU2NS28_9ACTN|nr:tetratricopeptide repeat protein [Streptomyces sp. DSM 42041]MDT0379790.1 tetratricopeptide repeat protein [Streptomyces sp. DSM 42041]
MQEYERAVLFYEARDYAGAARILRPLVDAEPRKLGTRLLLARAYYHSAQLGRAETELRAVLEQDPAEAYAHLVLGRTLERQNRPVEAIRHLRLAEAMTGGGARE